MHIHTHLHSNKSANTHTHTRIQENESREKETDHIRADAADRDAQSADLLVRLSQAEERASVMESERDELHQALHGVGKELEQARVDLEGRAEVCMRERERMCVCVYVCMCVYAWCWEGVGAG